MDRIKTSGFKYSLKIDTRIWGSIKPKIINDIKNEFRNGGYFQPFHGGDYLEIIYPFDRDKVYNGLCQLVIDAGDENITVCEICDYEKTNEAMKKFNKLVEKWKSKYGDPSMELRAHINNGGKR